MLPAPLLAAALAIVAAGLARGGGAARWLARALGGNTRAGRSWAWATATLVTYGGSAAAMLLLVGRGGAIVRMPPELHDLAVRSGFAASAATIPHWLLLTGGGGAAGLALVHLHRRRGGRAPGLRYRSPLAARPGDALLPAAAVAVAAGVGEELFFRLLLPLLIVDVTASAVLATLVPLLAFAALHRHQGLAGVAATGLVGAALWIVYLDTGALWVAMLLHVALDLNALVLRPQMIAPSA